MQFSPKILGLNIGIFWTVFRQSGTEIWTVCAVFMCYCKKKKKNNMLIL